MRGGNRAPGFDQKGTRSCRTKQQRIEKEDKGR